MMTELVNQEFRLLEAYVVVKPWGETGFIIVLYIYVHSFTFAAAEARKM